MFELVDLYESGVNATDEAEIYGGQDKTGHIHLDSFLGWLRKVRADQNAQYLKCLNWTKNAFEINNIVTVTGDANIVHKSAGINNVEETFDHVVKIAFKEESTTPAMTLATASDLFEAFAKKCEEEGIDTSTVEVFVQNEKGKLTYFAWYYDEGTDTAVIVKNRSPRQASNFLKHGAAGVLARAAKSPRTPEKLKDELAKIEEQMAKLASKRDAMRGELDAADPENYGF